MDLGDGRVGQLQDDVEVVDHQVEDYVHVEGAGAEDAEAVGLKEHGLLNARGKGGDGGVEALEVTDLDEAVVLTGEADEVVGLVQGGGDGLFDEQMQACLEEAGGGVEVGRGGDAD